MIQVFIERYFRASYNSYIKWDAHSLQQPPCKNPSHYGRVKNQQNITIMKLKNVSFFLYLL